MLTFTDGLDSSDRPLTAHWKESAGVFLDERELLRGIRLAVGRVVPRFRGRIHTKHHALDAPAGVAAGKCGGLIPDRQRTICIRPPPLPIEYIIEKKKGQ